MTSQLSFSFEVAEENSQSELLVVAQPKLMANSAKSKISLIPYGEAIHMPDKAEPHDVTYVAWNDEAEKVASIQQVWLKTQNEHLEVVRSPKLPIGYEMESHHSWILAATLIFCPELFYDSDYLALAKQDVESLCAAGVDVKELRLQVDKALT